jgi:hypothetical protein
LHGAATTVKRANPDTLRHMPADDAPGSAKRKEPHSTRNADAARIAGRGQPTTLPVNTTDGVSSIVIGSCDVTTCWRQLQSAPRIVDGDHELTQEVVADDAVEFRADGDAQHADEVTGADGEVSDDRLSHDE